jgi:hypothetical protein
MSATTRLLPPGFADLEPFAARWAVVGAQARLQHRGHSSEAERASFYAATKSRLADALALLDGKPLAQFDERERRLMQMLLSLCHVALAVEMQGSDEAAHRRAREYLTITRASADE